MKQFEEPRVEVTRIEDVITDTTELDSTMGGGI